MFLFPLMFFLFGAIGTFSAKPASASRSVWIGIATLLSVCFSIVIVGYATSRMWRNELSYSGVGTLTAFQVLMTYVVQTTWEWTQVHFKWVAGYVFVSGTVGLALSRGFVPEKIDSRWSVALETVIVALSLVAMVYPFTKRPEIAGGVCVLILLLKVFWWDSADSKEEEDAYRAKWAEYQDRQVGALIESEEFKVWFKKNHYRFKKAQ